MNGSRSGTSLWWRNEVSFHKELEWLWRGLDFLLNPTELRRILSKWDYCHRAGCHRGILCFIGATSCGSCLFHFVWTTHDTRAGAEGGIINALHLSKSHSAWHFSCTQWHTLKKKWVKLQRCWSRLPCPMNSNQPANPHQLVKGNLQRSYFLMALRENWIVESSGSSLVCV